MMRPVQHFLDFAQLVKNLVANSIFLSFGYCVIEPIVVFVDASRSMFHAEATSRSDIIALGLP